MSGENADLCAFADTAYLLTPASLGYAIQRSWSNVAVMAGHDPCVPVLPNYVYFNSTPVLSETVTVNVPNLPQFGPAAGKSLKVEGVTIPICQKKTLEVDLWSDADTKGPWSVEAIDVLAERYMLPPTLGFEWDRKTGVNGEKLHLTITALGASPLSVSLFEVVSTKTP